MKKRQSLKSTAAVMAGLIALTGTVSLIGYAAGQESTTTAEISTSESSSEASSETSSAEATTAGTAEIPAENAAEAPAEEINWTKADISAYDTSLSLVSYEETTPEMLATVGVKTASVSVTTRYLHSPCGLASLKYMESARALAEMFLNRIDEVI